MTYFDNEALRFLTKTQLWDEVRCFGNAHNCGVVIKDRFCPLKESCLARTAEIIGIRPKKEIDSWFEASIAVLRDQEAWKKERVSRGSKL